VFDKRETGSKYHNEGSQMWGAIVQNFGFQGDLAPGNCAPLL
jgi:hypothetical protein